MGLALRSTARQALPLDNFCPVLIQQNSFEYVSEKHSNKTAMIWQGTSMKRGWAEELAECEGTGFKTHKIP